MKKDDEILKRFQDDKRKEFKKSSIDKIDDEVFTIDTALYKVYRWCEKNNIKREREVNVNDIFISDKQLKEEFGGDKKKALSEILLNIFIWATDKYHKNEEQNGVIEELFENILNNEDTKNRFNGDDWRAIENIVKIFGDLHGTIQKIGRDKIWDIRENEMYKKEEEDNFIKSLQSFHLLTQKEICDLSDLSKPTIQKYREMNTKFRSKNTNIEVKSFVEFIMKEKPEVYEVFKINWNKKISKLNEEKNKFKNNTKSV